MSDRDWRPGNPAYDDIKDEERQRAEKVIASARVEEVPQKWYCTFGYDHVDPITGVRLRGKYCVVDATYGAARQIINERFGNEWSMVYPYANDLPEEERIVDGVKLSPFKWRGAGIEKYNLELFDHVTSAAVIADKLELDREKAGYYDDFTETQGFPPDWKEVED
jgi:hypothetical protein